MAVEARQHSGARLSVIGVELLTSAWALVLAAVCAWTNRRWFYDDGFITLRYARHLAEGLGPVWNRTGTPVEGFSSPLHLLLVAALLRFHLPAIFALRILSFAFHAAAVVYVWRCVRRRSGTTAAALAAALVTASWPMIVWDLGGLEAVPFATFLAFGTLTTLNYIESGARVDMLVGGLG